MEKGQVSYAIAVIITTIMLIVGVGIGWLAKPVPQPAPPPVEVPTIKTALKTAFIYVGPIGDYGWTYEHNRGRLYVENEFPWLNTVYAEAVPAGELELYVDRFILEEKVDAVITTSFGFFPKLLEMARKYPDKTFMQFAGHIAYEPLPNIGTAFSDLYQVKYLNGLIAGALTKTNKIGYVAAHAVPELYRHINAITLGAREVNPNATVHVRWLYAWYAPALAREAAEALIAEGVDVIITGEDTPTVMIVAQEHTAAGRPVYSFSHYSHSLHFAPDAVVSGAVIHWGPLYEEALMRMYLGTWKPKDYWWMLREGTVKMEAGPGVPINPKFVDNLRAKIVEHPYLGTISIYDLVMTRLKQMSGDVPEFDPFTGPIRDRDGVLKIEAGRNISVLELKTMDWFVEGVVGPIK